MKSKQTPIVEVVTTLVVQDGKVMVIFNPKWAAFSFPMSKRKVFLDNAISSVGTAEKLDRAAARVAAEVLGRSFPPQGFPHPLFDAKEYKQSDVDGIWKLYQFHVFSLQVTNIQNPASGIIAEWLTPDQINCHEPFSHTARYLLAQLEEKDLLPLSSL
jgi:hypothetical protein